ncbi:MAG TPA: SDR family NAD(P)-dependent oxidoreductase [Acidimicrobiales bacterium]|nr:SDR family NAD(P)-dependent oxidoreductase [Acidimicrobiales bacterium]
MDELQGRVAVVTGGASGIGRATVEALLAEGMRVVAADVEESALDATLRSIASGGKGDDVLGVVTDVSDGASMEALLARTVEHFGAVHLVHLNAGVAAGGPAWTLSEKDWSWVLGVNLWGVIHGVRVFVPQMLAQAEPAHVVITASMAGLMSSAFMSAYNVSKHGAVTLAETLHRDLAMAGAPIGVSVLCPGWVNTGIGDSGRNRPGDLRNEDGPNPIESGDSSPLTAMLQNGMPPAEVARMVVDAVKADRFYILTHDEWHSRVEARMGDILEGRNPTPMFLPT